MPCLSNNWRAYAITCAVIGQLHLTRVFFPTYLLNEMVASTFSETSHLINVDLSQLFVLGNCNGYDYLIGNRTLCHQIQSVFILVMKQIRLPHKVIRFCKSLV